MITIICVDPQDEGNIGAIARLMENFDIKDLIVVNTGHAPGKPTINHLSQTALDRASHAKDILKKARLYKTVKEAVAQFDYVLGTTALVGVDYNLKRTPLTPREIAPKIKELEKNNIALMFGREDHGLSNDELALCDMTITIPASKKSPVMNLSHACAVVLYELFSSSSSENQIKPKAMASKKEFDQMNKMISEILDNMKLTALGKKENQELLWKRIFAKSFMTRREAFGVMGFLKRLLGRR